MFVNLRYPRQVAALRLRPTRHRLRLAGLAAFAFLLQADGGDFVGVEAVADLDFALGADHDVLEFPAGVAELVAGGGGGVVGVDDGFFGGEQLFVAGGGGLDAVFRVDGDVVGDLLEGEVGLDVGLGLFSRNAGVRVDVRHGVSSTLGCRQKRALRRSILRLGSARVKRIVILFDALDVHRKSAACPGGETDKPGRQGSVRRGEMRSTAGKGLPRGRRALLQARESHCLAGQSSFSR